MARGHGGMALNFKRRNFDLILGGNSVLRGQWGPGIAAQSCGCPNPGGTQGHGWALGNLSRWGQPAHGRDRTGWALRSFSTQGMLWSYDSYNCSEVNIQIPNIVLSKHIWVTQLAFRLCALQEAYLCATWCNLQDFRPSVYSAVPRIYSSALPVFWRSCARCINLPWAMT